MAYTENAYILIYLKTLTFILRESAYIYLA